jgi:Tfp pilus assembly protein PilF
VETVGTLWNRARQLLTEREWKQAEAIYRQLVTTVPQAPELWHELGLVQLRAEQHDAACESLRQAVALTPKTPPTMSILARHFARSNVAPRRLPAINGPWSYRPPRPRCTTISRWH